MKKVIKYTLNYGLIMFLGHYIKIIGIPSIFDLPFIILIPYNYLAINYGIKKPLENNDDVDYMSNIFSFICTTSLIITVLYFLVNHDIGLALWQLFALLIINIIEFYLMVPKKQSLNFITQNNIKNYFKNKKRPKSFFIVFNLHPQNL